MDSPISGDWRSPRVKRPTRFPRRTSNVASVVAAGPSPITAILSNRFDAIPGATTEACPRANFSWRLSGDWATINVSGNGLLAPHTRLPAPPDPDRHRRTSAGCVLPRLSVDRLSRLYAARDPSAGSVAAWPVRHLGRLTLSRVGG